MIVTDEDKAMMEHLKTHPEKAKDIIDEAQKKDLEEIEARYNDVINAYAGVKSYLNKLVDRLVALKDSGFDEDSKEFQDAYASVSKEWDRLDYKFSLKHGCRYDSYNQEVERCEALYKELRSLVLN